MPPCFLSRATTVSAAVLVLATPAAVHASYTSTVSGTTATMVGDMAPDNLTITKQGGLLRHNRFPADPGFVSDADFDSSAGGEQSVPEAGGVINVDAGGGGDLIAFESGISLGTVIGGPGIDTLDYSAFTSPVVVNLGLGTAGLTGTLAPGQEVPPTTSGASGTVTISNYDIVAHTFDIQVTVTDLPPADVNGFHIHRAPVGVNGPIIVDFGTGSLVASGSGFTFSAIGLSLPGEHEAAFLGGATYVNVHTAAFPSGAIRGQLVSTGNDNLGIGTATGTASVSGVEAVTGGTGSDSLVGSFVVNSISGGGGADWIVGGPQDDTLDGDDGADVLVWNNGDGSDVMEGGPDADTLTVNGSNGGLTGDVFTVSANGTRIDFDRTNLGLFSLDIGTTETLTVNGLGGGDTITVNDLTGVAELATVSLNGLEGDDVIAYRPVSGGQFTYTVTGGGGNDTIDFSSASASGVTANLGLGTTGLTAGLDAAQEIQSVSTSAATGTAALSNYSVTAHTFDISVTVAGLAPADVTGFRIHQGSANGFGGSIVDLTGLAPLVPSGDGFTFTATNVTLPAAHEARLLGGYTYINIQTAAFPDGAIRGQIVPNANAPLSSGAATATTSISGVENLVGSPGSDSLIGNASVNLISGGNEPDFIIGGPGSDTLNGDAGFDVMIWNNGDGTDVVEGGADSDSVLVNGSPSSGDLFVVSPNGARIDFDRTSPGAFSLDLGAIEYLLVFGRGGDDSVTFNDLTGTGLLGAFLYGRDGNDTFTFTSSTTGVTFSLITVEGGTGTDTLQGPNADLTWDIGPGSGGGFALDFTTVVLFNSIESFAGGSGNDAFYANHTVAPSTVNGGAGSDTLFYDAVYQALIGDVTPPDGVFNAPGRQPVTFAAVEVVTILNPQPTISVTSSAAVREGVSTATLTVSLSGSSQQTISVNYATADGTAAAPGDYPAQSGTLTFQPGETFKTLELPANVDTLVEATESFFLNLSGAVNASILDAQAEISILDNARPTIGLILAQAQPFGTTTVGPLTFTVADTETPAGSLALSAVSSNPALVPPANIVFGGSGGSRTVTVTMTPRLPGTSTITVTVTDAGGATASRNFNVTVLNPTTVQPPTDLYVSAMSGNFVTFRFTPFPYGPQPTGFVLEGGLAAGEVLASLPTGSAAPIYSISAPTGSFYVRMHATTGSQKSGASNEIQIHVNVPVPPSAPDRFSSAVSGDSVSLAWRNTFGGGPPASLVLDVTGTFVTQIPLGLSETLSVAGAPPGTYTLSLRSLNGGGTSPASSPVSVTIPSPCPGPPEAPANFLGYLVGNTAYVVWDPAATGPAATSYTLSVTGSFVGNFPTPARALSGVVGPGSYIVSVVAVNPCGSSPPTPTQTIVVP